MQVSHHGCDVTADLPYAGPTGCSEYQSTQGRAAGFRGRQLNAFVLALLAGLAAAVSIWYPFSTVSVEPVLWLRTAISAMPMVLLWVALGAMRYQLRKTPFRYRDMLSDVASRLQSLIVTLSVITLFSVEILLLSYLATATSRPLMDVYLAAGDAALGFDWVAYVGRLNEHPWMVSVLSYAYFSLKVQFLLLPAILALTARSGRLKEFAAHFGLAGGLTCLIMMAVPAAGTMDFYHPSPDLLSSFGPDASARHLEQLHALRMLKPFLIQYPEGLVTFPSFHSALAAIFVYSVRGIRYVAPPVYLLNAMLILAALPEGGHYLVDILAGFAVAAVSILTVHQIAKLETLQQTGYQEAQSSEQQA